MQQPSQQPDFTQADWVKKVQEALAQPSQQETHTLSNGDQISIPKGMDPIMRDALIQKIEAHLASQVQKPQETLAGIPGKILDTITSPESLSGVGSILGAALAMDPATAPLGLLGRAVLPLAGATGGGAAGGAIHGQDPLQSAKDAATMQLLLGELPAGAINATLPLINKTGIWLNKNVLNSYLKPEDLAAMNPHDANAALDAYSQLQLESGVGRVGSGKAVSKMEDILKNLRQEKVGQLQRYDQTMAGPGAGVKLGDVQNQLTNLPGGGVGIQTARDIETGVGRELPTFKGSVKRTQSDIDAINRAAAEMFDRPNLPNPLSPTTLNTSVPEYVPLETADAIRQDIGSKVKNWNQVNPNAPPAVANDALKKVYGTLTEDIQSKVPSIIPLDETLHDLIPIQEAQIRATRPASLGASEATAALGRPVGIARLMINRAESPLAQLAYGISKKPVSSMGKTAAPNLVRLIQLLTGDQAPPNKRP